MFKMFSQKQSPKEVAKDRLKLILIHDRGDLSPETIGKMKVEILGVLSKYIDIELEDIDIAVTNPSEVEGDTPALIANIPIRSIKTK